MMIWNKHLEFKDFNSRVIQKFVISKKKNLILKRLWGENIIYVALKQFCYYLN